MPLPTDYTNETPSVDTHPAAHNTTNTEVNALGTRVTAVEGVDTAHRARRGPAGHWAYAWDINVVATAGIADSHTYVARMPIDASFDALAVEITTAAATSQVRLGVYASLASGMPGALLASGSVDSSTTGLKTVTFTALPAGVYWYATLTTIAGVSAKAGQAPSFYFMTGTPGTPTTIGPHVGFGRFTPADVLPDPYGTPDVAGTTIMAALVRFA